jgi:hypothetical protein
MDEKENSQPTDAGEPAESDLQEASHSTADYAKFEKPQKQRSPIWKKLGIGLAVLLFLAGLAGGGYWYLTKPKPTKKTETSSETTQTAPTVVASQISATTKRYSSSNFRLAFDYPDDWTVSDDADLLTVVSPTLKLKSSDGQQISGKILLTIETKGQDLKDFAGGNATASRASVKIDYTKPTQSQRASTYESFLRYAATANTAALDGVFITGDNGYTLGQAIPKLDIEKVNPIVKMTFTKCANQNCTKTSITASSWDDTTFSGPLENILKSLSIN